MVHIKPFTALLDTHDSMVCAFCLEFINTERDHSHIESADVSPTANRTTHPRRILSLG